ncbi:MAG: hypothetical protein COC24_019335 [Alphaproteobacteria bacterium]|nr:hypothetical protein [Alphaproteobacteria bacterium]
MATGQILPDGTIYLKSTRAFGQLNDDETGEDYEVLTSIIGKVACLMGKYPNINKDIARLVDTMGVALKGDVQ